MHRSLRLQFVDIGCLVRLAVGSPRMAQQKFLCSNCKFSVSYDYFGSKPPFSKDTILLEELYVMKDPFTDDKRCILLGGHCTSCKKGVCVSQDCSVFYSKRFCLKCVMENIDEFPDEIIQEIRKRKPKES